MVSAIERVDATEAAIHGRLRDLQCDSDHYEERQLNKRCATHPSVLASAMRRYANQSGPYEVETEFYGLQFVAPCQAAPGNSRATEYKRSVYEAERAQRR